MSGEDRGPAARYRVRIAGCDFAVSIRERDGAFQVSLGEDLLRRVDLVEVVSGRYALEIDGRVHDVAALPAAGGTAVPGRYSVTLDGETYLAEVDRHIPGSRSAAPVPAGRSEEVRSPMPGLLVAVQAAPGAQVAPGQPLIIMEAMKMQMEIRAPRAGTVRLVHVTPGEEVATGRLLVTLE